MPLPPLYPKLLNGFSKPPRSYPDLDWRDIPVYIVNRNRCDVGFKTLVTWLREIGTRRIVILDNASTYQPLMDFYALPDSGLDIRLMQYNGGPWVFWNHELQNRINTPYIVTDSDLAPAEGCPADLIEQMLKVMNHYKDACWKVGPGLRVDNIPDSYEKKAWMHHCERNYMLEEHRRIVPGLAPMFQAPIDTTFALYHAGGQFNNEYDYNYRLDKPYVFEHRPWYVDSANLSPEDQYYHDHRENGWSGC